MTSPNHNPCCPNPSHSQLPDLTKMEEMTLHLIRLEKEVEAFKNAK